MLVGLAIDQDLIAGVDTPLFDFFPQHADLRSSSWDRITLHHLLSMSMGLDWSDEEGEQIHDTGDPFFRMVLSREVTGTPGEQWRYVNPNINLLAGVIRQASGLHADHFADQFLFAPLGIKEWSWAYGERDGYRLMDGSLHMRPRDMAKLGSLILRDGLWQGKQVISADWVHESTAPRLPTDEESGEYGYLWWLRSIPTPGGARQMIFANGWGSQFIVIFPELDMVVVTTGGNEDNGKHFAIGMMLSQHLLPHL